MTGYVEPQFCIICKEKPLDRCFKCQHLFCREHLWCEDWKVRVEDELHVVCAKCKELNGYKTDDEHKI